MDPFARLIFATHTSVFEAMSAAGLAKVKSLSRTLRELELLYERTAFSVHRLYDPFFNASTIESFRKLQLTTESLVSGSAVVKFLSRGSFAPSDLDIFARLAHVARIGRFLEGVGYKYAPMPTVVVAGVKISVEQHHDFETAVKLESLKCSPNTGTLADRYEFTTIAGVFNFVKGGAKVQLVACRTEPVEVVLGFYSTLVMNIVTSSEVISFYPRTSFVSDRALYLKQGTRTVDTARQKYEARGWQSYDVVSAEEFLRPWSELSGVTRWVGDPRCWVVQLSPLDGFKKDGGFYWALKAASWQITCGYDSTWVLKNRMDNQMLERTYPVTWNAQMSVWHHPCLSSLEERMAVTKRGLPLGSTSLASVSTAKLAAAVELVNTGGCSSIGTRPVLPPSTMDSILVDFLKALYPLLAQEHRSSWPMVQLRCGFARLKSVYAGRNPPLRYPTGHVVAMILTCLEDLDVSGLCDDVEVRVSFAVDLDRQMVTTLCDVLVSSGRLAAIEKEIQTWTCSEDFMDQAGLTVRVRSA